MVFIIFLLGISIFINVAVGAIAYLAILESRQCRHECERCRTQLAGIFEQLNHIREQTPLSPTYRAEKPPSIEPFARILSAALANYDAAQAA